MAKVSSASSILCLLLCFVLFSSTKLSEAQIQGAGRRRSLLGSVEKEEASNPPPKNKLVLTDTKNHTKLLLKLKKTNSTVAGTKGTPSILKTKPLNSTANKLPKPSNPTNTTKLLKPTNLTHSTNLLKPTELTNATATAKSLNSTSNAPKLKKPTDLPKTQFKPSTDTKTTKNQQQQQQHKPKTVPKPVPIMPWIDESDDGSDDLIKEFRDLPSKIHSALLPDIKKMSSKSKAYLTLANKEFSNTFKPIVGTKYAPTAATATSAAFLLLPLSLIAILLHHIRSFLSLPKIILSIHIYLAVYFATLSLTAAATGLDPLRFFHATSPGSYAYTQVLQTLWYVLFLLLQLMYLVVAFSTPGAGSGSRALALGQLLVSMAVGLHYYAAVFHRAVVGDPPRTNWKIHAVYASCFIVICAFGRAERRKKAYLQRGDIDDGKNS